MSRRRRKKRHHRPPDPAKNSRGQGGSTTQFTTTQNIVEGEKIQSLLNILNHSGDIHTILKLMPSEVLRHTIYKLESNGTKAAQLIQNRALMIESIAKSRSRKWVRRALMKLVKKLYITPTPTKQNKPDTPKPACLFISTSITEALENESYSKREGLSIWL